MSRIARLAFIAFAAVTLQTATAFAQDWPTKPVRILIGFGAGGTMAGGMAARAPKDGYTAIALSMGHAVSAVMVKQVPYDPVADFQPIGIFTNSAIVVAVGKNSPATDLKSLVAYVNSQGGKLNYSTVGLGSTQHLIAEDLRQRLSIQAQAVAYRTTGEVVTALIRGDSAFAVDLYHAIRGQVDGGELRVIATSTPNRWPGITNVPTVAESGIPGFGVLGWYGLAFPAGVPQPVVDKMRTALKDVLARDTVRKRLEGVGAIANLSTPEEFGRVIQSDINGFKEVAGKAGLQAQ